VNACGGEVNGAFGPGEEDACGDEEVDAAERWRRAGFGVASALDF
jgi:hypothetical protein